MADYKIGIDPAQIENLVKKFVMVGKDAIPPIMRGIDDICELVANHAKENHYFVGTGVRSGAKAIAGEFAFMNPDGSLRFKIRTNNLLRSIQSRGAKVDGGIVRGQVFAGMEYARKVEEGDGSHRAFPLLKPAMLAVEPKATGIIKNALKKALESFGR